MSENNQSNTRIARKDIRSDSASSETNRIVQINNKLKSELLTVIGQMEVQLRRVKEKRQERLDTERQTNRLYGGKAREIRQGEKKKENLKR